MQCRTHVDHRITAAWTFPLYHLEKDLNNKTKLIRFTPSDDTGRGCFRFCFRFRLSLCSCEQKCSCGKITVKQESSTYCAVRKGSCSRQKDDCAWWPGKVTILQGARNLCRYSEEKRYGGLWSKTRNWKWTIQSFASKYATAMFVLTRWDTR